MAEKQKKNILWEVGCDGHTDAWVIADTWEQATVKAAEFWKVPWSTVAAHCFEKTRIVGAPRNVCHRCKRMYSGPPPVCAACAAVLRTEEDILRRRRNRAYEVGKLV